jgi:hypothetical protein
VDLAFAAPHSQIRSHDPITITLKKRDPDIQVNAFSARKGTFQLVNFVQ